MAMIGIVLTDDIKFRNNIAQSVGTIYTKSAHPQVWWGVERVVGGYTFRTDLHLLDGWKQVVRPSLGENQKLGALFLDVANDVFTYPVIDLTPEEIAANIASASEANKEQKIREKLELQVVQEMQASTDANEQLDGIDIYPFWEPDLSYTVDYKVKFVHEAELKLYRVVQAHTSQSDWTPPVVPALFTRVTPAGQILPWVQPTGAQDAYQIGDIVSFGGQNWISIEANNVWQPGVFGWNVTP